MSIDDLVGQPQRWSPATSFEMECLFGTARGDVPRKGIVFLFAEMYASNSVLSLELRAIHTVI